jgi:hypothetical protein
MPYLEIIKIIIPIVVITGIGYIFGKLKKTNINTLADFIIYVSSPTLALTLLSRQPIVLKDISNITLSVILVVVGAGVLTYLFSRVTGLAIPSGLYLPIMFMNSGFIGYPLAFFVFGKAGLGKAIIYDVVNAILIFTVGLYIASQGKDRWQVLKLPFIYAALAGIMLSLNRITIPQYIYSPLSLIAGTTIPLALFMLGCRLTQIKIVSWKLPLLASVLRLLGGFMLGLLAVFLFRLHGVSAKTVILVSSLSSAVTTAALAEEYNADPDLVASTIALSTVLSIIVIVFILKFLPLF